MSYELESLELREAVTEARSRWESTLVVANCVVALLLDEGADGT
ncbi:MULTISPECIES: hypothetical protein [Streptomyces]